MIYLLLSAVLASPAFAQTPPLLQLDQYSGYVQPEFAMEAHCSVNQTHIVAQIFQDHTGADGTWKTQTNVDQPLSVTELNQLQTWIKEAEAGPFKPGANPCDIGTFTVVTQNYPLIVSKDCGKRIENQHPSALQLIAWMRHACSLDGSKGKKQ